MKLRWSKLSPLLQRVAFLVIYLAKRFVYYISAVHFFSPYSRLTKFFSTNLLTKFFYFYKKKTTTYSYIAIYFFENNKK